MNVVSYMRLDAICSKMNVVIVWILGVHSSRMRVYIIQLVPIERR